jgi:hypothetical protein
MHHSFNVLVLNILASCFGILECQHQKVIYEHDEMVSNVGGVRDGRKLYVVTDGEMVHFAVCHIGHHLSMFISDSLMMAF